ncbi:MAG TPA: hypothetical protein ENJ18_06765 [Nannocystis exedens]|nr:hypothetical protein [Nannocystis exedens]
MAKAPLSLLLGGHAPHLVAEDRHLVPGVRLRRLRLRPTFAGHAAELIQGGPGRVSRLLERPVVVERCEIEIREQAIREGITRGLCGLSISGMQISSVDLRGNSGQTMDVELHLQLVGMHGRRAEWGARLALSTHTRTHRHKSRLVVRPRTLWAVGGVDPELLWAALMVRASARGIVAERGALLVDPIALWIDRWLVLGGHRPLRRGAAAELQLRRNGHGSIEVMICECALPSVATAGALNPTLPTVIVDAPAQILGALRAGRGLAVYDELAAKGGQELPESAVLALSKSCEFGEACEALELAVVRGSRRARAPLAIRRGLSGDRRGLLTMLAHEFRVAPHPVHRARFRMAWALCTATLADGVREARQELEALVAEIGDGRWPSAVVGEVWAALAKLRGADPEVSAELVFAAAIEASHHMSTARGGETLLWTAVELHGRGVASDERIARRARAAGFALAEDPDPELLDRLRHWEL